MRVYTFYWKVLQKVILDGYLSFLGHCCLYLLCHLCGYVQLDYYGISVWFMVKCGTSSFIVLLKISCMPFFICFYCNFMDAAWTFIVTLLTYVHDLYILLSTVFLSSSFIACHTSSLCKCLICIMLPVFIAFVIWFIRFMLYICMLY